MPDVARVLVTDRKTQKGQQFTRVIASARTGDSWYVNAIRYYGLTLQTEYERILLLDTDVHILYPIYELFDMLDRFDFMGVHEGPRQTAPTVHPIPKPFSEFNIGVLMYKNSDGMKTLFANWLRMHEEHQDVYGNNDQASLREAVWMDDQGLQFYVVPSEWNCRFHFGTWVKLQVKVMHGRSKDIGKVEREVNRQAGKMRAWRPKELLRL